MEIKKGVAVLVVVALVLAVTAITLQVTDSNEVPTMNPSADAGSGSGDIGITIVPGEIEDKGAEVPGVQS